MQFNHKSGQHIPVDDAKIYVEEIGDKNKPVLLLLHGGMNTLEIFNTLLKELPENFPFRLIGIDSRGHGKSTLGTKELTYELLQKEVEEVLKQLGIKKLSLLGFSNGGKIAYRLAAFTNLNIEKIITISSPWHTQYLKPLFPAFEKIPLEIWKQQSPDDYEIYQRINPEPNIEEVYEKSKKMALDTSEKSRPGNSVRKIACAVLAIRGEKDPFVSEESLKEFCRLVKNAKTVTIPDSGHMVLLEKPKSISEEIQKFLLPHKRDCPFYEGNT